MRRWLHALLLLAVLPIGALAAPQGPARKRVVTFDGDQIDGDLMRPEGDLLSVRPQLDLPSLVEPPASFARASRRTLLAAADALVNHKYLDSLRTTGTRARREARAEKGSDGDGARGTGAPGRAR